ncbi:MAG: DUF2062 domain-containing protein [Nanoarchaeota archaeon]
MRKMIDKHVKSVRDKVDSHIDEIKKTKIDPHNIAFGFAIGTFINILPIPFINLWIGLLVVLMFKKINKYALLAALLFWNPITLIPIYSLSFTIGNTFFVNLPNIEYDIVLLTYLFNFTKRFLIGNLILAIPVALVAYLIVFVIVKVYLIAREIKSKKFKSKAH